MKTIRVASAAVALVTLAHSAAWAGKWGAFFTPHREANRMASVAVATGRVYPWQARERAQQAVRLMNNGALGAAGAQAFTAGANYGEAKHVDRVMKH
jgi:hypothetical protein